MTTFDRANDFVWLTGTDYDAKARLTSYSLKTNINWSVAVLEGAAASINSNGLLTLQSTNGGQYR